MSAPTDIMTHWFVSIRETRNSSLEIRRPEILSAARADDSWLIANCRRAWLVSFRKEWKNNTETTDQKQNRNPKPNEISSSSSSVEVFGDRLSLAGCQNTFSAACSFVTKLPAALNAKSIKPHFLGWSGGATLCGKAYYLHVWKARCL